VIQRVVTGLLVAVLSISSMLPAFAGTTGGLRGQVIDLDTHKGLPGVKVSVVSPSQSATATTDANGTFTFISLIPDTYTISVQPPGYDSATQSGINIIADQTQNASLTTAKIVATIGRTVSRPASSLVRSGITSDVYTVNAAGAEAAQALGGSGGVNQAYSAMASVAGVSLQQGQQGWNQAVYIRGGDYEDVAFELDGIPVQRASDGAPITTLSNLGQGQLQVYTGGAPASADASGLSGYVNQVVRSGTYPGFGDIQAGIGGPALYNKFQFEVGGATTNRLFSYYVGYLGVNQDYRYADQFNGASNPSFFAPLAVVTGPAGVYAGAPGGYFNAPGQSYSISNTEDREFITNLHFGIPHKDGSGQDDIQLLYANGRIFSPFYSSVNDLGGDAVVANAIGAQYYGGVPTPAYWNDQYVYNGPVGVPVTGNPSTSPYYFPSSPPHTFLSALPDTIRDTTDNNFSILKLQYQKNINDKSYFRLFAYSSYNNWFINGPVSANLNYSGELSDYEVNGHTYGANLRYENQLSTQNLLTVTGSYQTQKSQTISSDTFGAVTTNLVAPNGGCIGPNGTYVSCFTPTTAGGGLNVVTQYGSTPGSFTPYAAPAGSGAQWIVTENGYEAQLDTVQPFFSAFSVGDQFRPSNKLMLNAGIRFESFVYKLASTDEPARQFWFNAWNNENCYTPGNAAPTNQSALIDPATGATPACPAGSVALNNSSPSAVSYGAWQPRVGLTYTFSPDTVVRASYGRYAQQPGASYQQYNTVQQNLPNFLANFLPYGYNSPYHPTAPSYANSYDISLEQHIPGTDMAFKLTPYYRSTQNVLQSIPIGAQGIVDGLNTGSGRSDGIEFEFTKGDFSRQGLSFQLAYTFTNTVANFGNFITGNNFIDNLNVYIKQYNAYTQACATNTNPKNQGCVGATTPEGVPAAQAAPCYTTGGTPDPSCASGDIANPYWNAPAQPLFDRTGSYTPYDILPSNPYNGAVGFVTPTVVTAVINYRKGNFTFTPSGTYTSGTFYGSPLTWPGYDPATCPAAIAGTTQADTTQCTGALLQPDVYTGKFDEQGAFREPTRFTLNAQMGYEFSKHVRATLTFTGLIDHCYQRGYAWDNPTTCVYAQLPSNKLAPVGNFVTPVSSAPVQLQYPYGSFYNNVQTGFVGQKMPLAAFLNFEFRF
jgi:hypothetical protein